MVLDGSIVTIDLGNMIICTIIIFLSKLLAEIWEKGFSLMTASKWSLQPPGALLKWPTSNILHQVPCFCVERQNYFVFLRISPGLFLTKYGQYNGRKGQVHPRTSDNQIINPTFGDLLLRKVRREEGEEPYMPELRRTYVSYSTRKS